MGGDGWSWGVLFFVDKPRSSELNLKRKIVVLYGLCFLINLKGWRSSAEKLHTPHSLSAERRCNAHLHWSVFWLAKAEVCDGKHRQPYLCVCSLALGWGPEAEYGLARSCCPCVVFPLAHAFPMLQRSPLLEKCPFIFVVLRFDLLFLFLLQIWIPKYCLTLWNYAERVYPAWTLGQNHTFFRTVQRLF